LPEQLLDHPKIAKVLRKIAHPFFLLATPRSSKALVYGGGDHVTSRSAVAAGGEVIHLMFDTARQPRRGFDCGRGFNGLGIDRGGKLPVIHGRSRR
jgi:hypothetical protein